MHSPELLTKYLGHPPTAEQQKLFVMLDTFLHSDQSWSAFVLKGYAGTGKTTAISALVKMLAGYKLKSVLLAPTGRAAKVLAGYSGRQAYTIHKKIYRKKSASDFGSAFVLAENKHKETIFIVDEASMITDQRNDTDLGPKQSGGLLHDLVRYVYETDTNCRIIFVGDTAQLPPVGSQESPALAEEQLRQKYDLEVHSIELKEVLRQGKSSGILENATAVRDLISSEDIKAPRFQTKGFPDFYRINGDRLLDGLNYAYDKYGVENTLVVCRSNKSANLYNQHIRAQILYREEEITGGDHIMIVKNNYFWLPEESESAFIANGDIAKVIRIRTEQEIHGFRFCEATLQMIDIPGEPIITAKIMLDTLSSESPNLSYDQQKALYDSVVKDYEWIKTKKERMEKIKNDPFYNALQIKFAYAVTCHKSQGGQWPCVFIDQGYLTEEMLNKDFLRWLYTAITRASKEVFLVNFNGMFFGQ
jgi:exodeoxyribonuclease-5